MPNDNRRQPDHGHDPEHARQEALRAREARQQRSGREGARQHRTASSGTSRQVSSAADRHSSSHNSAASRRKAISHNSRYQQVRRQKMLLAGGGILLVLLLVIIFSAYIFSLLYEIMSGYLRGFGISFVPALLTTIGVCGTRIAWVYAVFPNHRSFSSLMMVYPVSLSTTALLILITVLVYHPARRYQNRTDRH